MSRFKLEFKLKQHTPIIHFQGDQHGATLRATELKPKLDKFLITKIGDSNYKDFLIAGQKEALDYKVKIEQSEDGYDANDKSLKNFFGNQGNGEKKYGVTNNKVFNLTIICYFPKLTKYIEDFMARFLALHNFGTRQSKGYGSYYLDKSSIGYKDIEDVLPSNTYYLEIGKNDSIDEAIKYFWSRFKSGINLHYVENDINNTPNDEKYKHSFVKKYAYKNNISWEKRWIKSSFFGLKPSDTESFFVRALFGLPSSFSYMATTEPNNPIKNKLKIDNKFTIDIKHDDIGRIPAPYIFKPINNERNIKIFILPNFEPIKDFCENYQNKSFIFSLFWGSGRDRKPQEDKNHKEYYYVIKNDLDNNPEYKKFINDFWERKNGNKYQPKIFTSRVPTNLNIYRAMVEFIEKELSRDYTTYYTSSRNKIDNFSVKIHQTKGAKK